MAQSEQERFLSDLEVKENADVLEAPLTEESAENTETEESSESSEMKLKNRRERRLAQRLQAEREANIELNARLQTINESKQIREGSEEAEYLKRVERIYGNATPEAKEATELLKEALRGVHESAKQEALTEALEKFQSEKANEAKAVQQEEQNLDEILDEVEEDYGIDMSNESDRKGYLNLLEKLSPKDDDGNIIEFADPDATAELYLSRKEKSNSRAKELASRSMVRSGASPESKLEMSSAERFLKENGII